MLVWPPDIVAYNPTAAKKLLDAAGWSVQGSQRIKNGKTLSLTLVIGGGVSVVKSIAELMQNMLGQINVDLAINAVPPDVFFDKYITPGQFDLTIFLWVISQFPISSAQPIYVKPVGDNIQENYARIGSDEIDELFRKSLQELDPAQAILKANDADTAVWAEVHSLPLYQLPDLWAVNKSFANIGAFGFASIAYENIGFMAVGGGSHN